MKYFKPNINNKNNIVNDDVKKYKPQPTSHTLRFSNVRKEIIPLIIPKTR